MDGITLHPVEASTVAPQVDLLFYCLLAFSLALGIFLVAMVLTYAVKYRRGSPASRTGRQTRTLGIEIAWTSAAGLIALGIFLWGAQLFLERDNPPADAMRIAAFGKQWMWKFEHDNGRREINELHIPVDKPVLVSLSSEDVIHSLFIPAFRVKQDAVPGRMTKLWFQATRTGRFDLFCAEYCGTEHSEMRGSVVVMQQGEYSHWLATGPSQMSLAEQGAELFRALGCSGCHGAGGTVRAPPLENVYGRPVALADRRTVLADEGYLRDSILEPLKDVAAGYEPVMPSFKDLIEEDDLMKIIVYLKSLSAAEHAP